MFPNDSKYKIDDELYNDVLNEIEQVERLSNGTMTDEERDAFLIELYNNPEKCAFIGDLFDERFLEPTETTTDSTPELSPRINRKTSQKFLLRSMATVAAALLVCATLSVGFLGKDRPEQYNNNIGVVQELAVGTQTFNTIDSSLSLKSFGVMLNGATIGEKSVNLTRGGTKRGLLAEQAAQVDATDEYDNMTDEEIFAALETIWNQAESNSEKAALAKPLCDRLSPAAKASLMGLVNKGLVAFFSDDLQEAETAFRAAMTIDANNFAVLYNLATTLALNGKEAEAEILKEQIKLTDEYKDDELLQLQFE